MRTKALFVAAATGIAALTTSLAQVYSVNVVGYINLDLANGFNLVANQLDNGNGNLIVDVIGDQLPDGSGVFKYVPGVGYRSLSWSFGAWSGQPDALAESMAPGEAIFINSIGASTVTVVGEVMEGAQDVSLPQGFSTFSAVAPVASDLSATEVAFPVEDGDSFWTFDASTQQYVPSSYSFGAWSPAALVLQVGQAAWVNKISTQTWTRDFTVPRS